MRNFTMQDVTVLYEDNSILVVVKPQNLPSQADKSGDVDLLTLLKGYVKEKYNKPGNVYLGLVHRLDRPTGGVMVFAKNSKSAQRLSERLASGKVSKRYLAAVVGCPKEQKGTLVNYLKKNPLTNTVYVATVGDHDAKRAELSYEVLQRGGILVCDNVLYKGLVEHIPDKRHKHITVARNLNSFLRRITADDSLETTVYRIGDGVSVTRKK